MKELMLHSGGVRIDREELKNIPTPEPMGIWRPIPHETLFDLVEKTILDNGFGIDSVDMGVGKDGNRFFALMRMAANGMDYCSTVGIRNSHDKSFPAGLVVGLNVFICDNLAFSGEIAIARKHTVHILDDLPGLVIGAVGKISTVKQLQDARINAYKEFGIDDYDVHDTVIRAVDYGIIPNQALPYVLEQWRKPKHPEFEERTVWSLFNAFTEIAKRFPVADLPRRTIKLHGMLDSMVGQVIDITPEQVN